MPNIEKLLGTYDALLKDGETTAATNLLAGALYLDDLRITLAFCFDCLNRSDEILALQTLRRYQRHKDNPWYVSTLALAATLVATRAGDLLHDAADDLQKTSASNVIEPHLASYLWGCLNNKVRADERLRTLYNRLYPPAPFSENLQGVGFKVNHDFGTVVEEVKTIAPPPQFFEDPSRVWTTKTSGDTYLDVSEVGFQVLRNVKLYMVPGVYGLVELSDGRLLGPESGSLNPYVGSIFGKVGANVVKRLDCQPDNARGKLGSGRYMLPFRFAGTYYFHFMAETMNAVHRGRLGLSQEVAAIVPAGNGFFDRMSKEVHQDALSTLDANLLAIEDGIYELDELIVPDRRTYGGLNYQSQVLSALSLEGAESAGNVLFIARRNGMVRSIENQDAMLAYCQAHIHGFKAIYLEDMSFYEQIKVFRTARGVIAPHGGGLTNILFCKPGTVVVELHKAETDVPYWHFSLMNRLRYLSYMPARGEHNANYCISAEKLVEAFDAATRLPIVGRA